MPVVNVPDVGRVNFPDSMSPEEIEQAIEADILPTEEAPKKRSALQQFGRAASMQGLEALKGATNLVLMPADALNEFIEVVRNPRAIARAIKEDPRVLIRPSPTNPSRLITDPLTAIQPQPESKSEQWTTRMAGALGGAAGGIGLGRAIPGAVGAALAESPALQAAGAVTGPTAGQIAQELGAGPGVQMLASVAGGAAPAVAKALATEGTKSALRGGATRQQVEDNVSTFRATGASPTAGQATESRFARGAESLLSRTPGGAGVMARAAGKQADDLGAGIEKQAASLAAKSSGEQAGRAIQRGISDQGGFLDTFKGKSAQLYGEIDQHIAGTAAVPVSNTQRVLAELTRKTPGAEAITGRLVNKRILGIAEDMAQDAANGTIPYEALKSIRTRIGEELADGSLMSDVPTAQFKKLYGALSADLEAAAKAAGPDAERAFTRANNYYRAGSRRMEVLQSVVDKNGGPEAVFKAAVSGTKDGSTTVRAVMQSLPKDQQKVVAATILRRLGRAKAGVQDDLGEAFSTETFLTNWNSMSPEAKGVLFNRFGPKFRESMDQVAKVAANLREGSKVFRNPSGTAQAELQAGTVGALAVSAATGQYETAAAILAGVGTANGAARLMTHPPFVEWLAKATRAPKEALPVMINQLAQSPDPVMREAAAALRPSTQEQPNRP